MHLGQDDLPLRAARAILGPERVIGISVDSVAQAVAAERDGADYLGVSPVFATPTKTDTAAPLGLEGLAAIRRAVGIPLVAIGGIGARNAAEVIRAGADGVAVVSAIVAAADPQRAAAEIAARIPASEGRMSLKDIGEFGFIRRIRNGGLVRPEGVVLGIGDDAAAFRQAPAACP